jgi:hypothetical protein
MTKKGKNDMICRSFVGPYDRHKNKYSPRYGVLPMVSQDGQYGQESSRANHRTGGFFVLFVQTARFRWCILTHPYPDFVGSLSFIMFCLIWYPLLLLFWCWSNRRRLQHTAGDHWDNWAGGPCACRWGRPAWVRKKRSESWKVAGCLGPWRIRRE